MNQSSLHQSDNKLPRIFQIKLPVSFVFPYCSFLTNGVYTVYQISTDKFQDTNYNLKTVHQLEQSSKFILQYLIWLFVSSRVIIFIQINENIYCSFNYSWKNSSNLSVRVHLLSPIIYDRCGNPIFSIYKCICNNFL